jgi:hypothetical protein
MRRRLSRISSIVGAVILLSTSLASSSDAAPDTTADFLAYHWQRPLKSQGAAPEGFSALEASLEPTDCGSCHPRQFDDWRQSLHAHAMGPGLLGQLVEMAADDRLSHQACLRCHAPLAEQADDLVAVLQADRLAIEERQKAGSRQGMLYRQGLVCAACHLREGVVYGPPRRDTTLDLNGLPHGGFQERDAFADSRFCAACHQFDADGFTLNGKLLENTFEEWRASPQAEAGESCQSCHMPDRRHLWRGIHDRDTVLSGVTIELSPIAASGRVGGTLRLTNSGTGHRFPTYVTPRVVLQAVQLDSNHEPIEQTKQERVVARDVRLDLSEENFDTRLAPGESMALNYAKDKHPQARSMRFDIRVEPERFYREFYRSLLQDGSDGRGRKFLQTALRKSETSDYLLYRKIVTLEAESKE